jgi:hypothetical protein
MLRALGDVQIPVLALMLLGGCAAKLARSVQRKSIDAEFAFGVGLIVTSGSAGQGPPAELVRLGTSLLFIVATCALIELRSIRPDIGCGCFGEFSVAPITGRTLARSALLAAAALGAIDTPPIRRPRTAGGFLGELLLIGIELGIIALLSPELRDVLVRIGYSAPCELRIISPEHTLAVLQRSAQWRRHSALVADHEPSDMWRELCWRYVTFPSRLADRDTELVFAMYLAHRRPIVLSVLVDAATGAVLPWPASAPRRGFAWRVRLPRRSLSRSPRATESEAF